MSIGAVSTFLFNDQSRTDLSQLQTQLANLQAEVSSGNRASDLSGFGGASSQQILSTQNLMAQTTANANVAKGLDARFTTIDQSLGSAQSAGETLRQSVLSAIGNNNGAGLSAALQTAFDSARTALNTTYQGQALFGGERGDATPINVSSLSNLAAAPSVSAIFDESARPQTANVGSGSFAVAPTASTVSSGLFDAMRTLQQTITAAGGSLSSPLTAAQTTALQGVAAALSTAGQTLTAAQGANGDLQKRVETSATNLSNQADMLKNTVGTIAGADLASVATQISALQTQYQAVAQTYSQLSRLSLLSYLSTTPI
jgi:flagellar hook-associated protein 3 FlgL